MSKKMAKALEESIAHWKRMHDAKTPDALGDESPCGDSCPLCAACRTAGGWTNCEKCPVFKKTGKDQCDGSPWADARDAFRHWRNSVIPRAAWRRAARKEIAFLESLREQS